MRMVKTLAMIRSMLLAVVLTFGVACRCAGQDIQGVTPTQVYDQAKILDGDADNAKYAMFWSYSNTDVTFEVHVKTKGWIGFGLSDNGNMFPADVVIGWVSEDGSAHLSDRHTTGMTEPLVDVSQDWNLLYGAENGVTTVLKFVRKIDTCDKDGDMIIQQGTSRIIYAYGSSDPQPDGTITYHSQSRGTVSVALLSSVHVNKELPAGTITFDILNQDVAIPARDTTYWCRSFRMPELGSKHHLIKYEAIVTPGNEQLVHHILIYRCAGISPVEGDGVSLKCWDPLPKDFPRCNSFWLTWAIGGEPFHLPDHVGLPVGGPDDNYFYVLGTHFNNPDGLVGHVDTSGLRLTVTPELRPQEAGIIEMGETISRNLIIPPHQQAFMSKGYCSENCLMNALQNEDQQEFNAFAVFHHSHRIGVSMTTRHYRNGAELEPLLEEPHYDVKFQNFHVLREERTVYPGDSFRVDCTYDSRTRSEVTMGGTSSQQEMCMTHLFYYPRSPLVHCTSDINYNQHEYDLYTKSVDWSDNTVVANFVENNQQLQRRHRCQGDETPLPSNNELFVEKDDQTPFTPPPADCP